MRKGLEALEKLDHTICLNLNRKGEGKLKFGLDDLDGIDCKDFDEFDECHNTVEKNLELLEELKKIFKFRVDDRSIAFKNSKAVEEHYFLVYTDFDTKEEKYILLDKYYYDFFKERL